MKLIDNYSVALKMMTRSPNGEGNHEIPQSIKEGIKKIFGKYLSPQEVAIEITEAVRKQGDSAIKKYTSMIDQVELDSLVVDEKEMNDAVATLDKEVFDALVHAADRITEFHKSTIRKSWVDHESGLGEIMRPLERIGLYAVSYTHLTLPTTPYV